MSIEATLGFRHLSNNETYHFDGVISTPDGVWPYHCTHYTKFSNGVTAEQSIGVAVGAGAVKGPAEAKFVVEVTRKAKNKLGELDEPVVEAHYNGAIYGKTELQNDPAAHVMRYFFKEIAPAIDAKLDDARERTSMRFGLAAKLYQ